MNGLEQVVYESKARIAENSEAIGDLKEWQKRQNGSLQRIEGKVDKLYYIIIGAVLLEVVFKFLK